MRRQWAELKNIVESVCIEREKSYKDPSDETQYGHFGIPRIFNVTDFNVNST